MRQRRLPAVGMPGPAAGEETGGARNGRADRRRRRRLPAPVPAPAPVEIVNDLSRAVATFFRVPFRQQRHKLPAGFRVEATRRLHRPVQPALGSDRIGNAMTRFPQAAGNGSAPPAENPA